MHGYLRAPESAPKGAVNVWHHVYPQAMEFRAWFEEVHGIDIEQYLMYIPEELHQQLHSGGPGGGLWNAIFRGAMQARVTTEKLFEGAAKLTSQFGLGKFKVGPRE
jgi:hypothetical protein